jgi:hypothetical protein
MSKLLHLIVQNKMSLLNKGKKRTPLVLSEHTVLVENEHSRKYVEKNTNAAQHVSDILS